MPNSPAPCDAPLVSIVIRTMWRPVLKDALASVVAQTYRPLELVLVDAAGTGIIPNPDLAVDIELRAVSLGIALPRARAANAGLAAATGRYVMFLDEDDWVSTEHVSGLIAAIEKDGKVHAAYSATQKTDANGQFLAEQFRVAWDPILLMKGNYIPIHSVVFEKSLVDGGCRFDESMDIYEDWDFWLQLSEKTSFLFLDVLSAFYRCGGTSDILVDDEKQCYQPDHRIAIARETIYQKWLHRWSGRQLNALIGRLDQSKLLASLNDELLEHDLTIQQRDMQLEQINQRFQQLEDALGHTTEQLRLSEANLQIEIRIKNELSQLIDQTRHEIANLLRDKEEYRFHTDAHIRELETQLNEIYRSFSWFITRPYRGARKILLAWFLRPALNFVKRMGRVVLPHFPRLRLKVQQYVNLSVATTPDQNNAIEIFHSLDSPSEANNLFSDSLTVTGWAFSAAGEVTGTIFIDGQEYSQLKFTENRPDVERVFQAHPSASNSGFYQVINLEHLPAGAHWFELQLACKGAELLVNSCAFHLLHGNELYKLWMEARQIDSKTGDRRAGARPFNAEGSKVSILMDCSGSAEAIQTSLSSLLDLSFRDWQCYLVGDSLDGGMSGLAQLGASGLDRPMHCFDTVTSALAELVSEPGYVLVLGRNRRLNHEALDELLDRADQSCAQLIYCDHDRLGRDGERCSPEFTFGWSPDHLLARNYVGDVYLAHSTLFENMPIPSSSESWPYRLMLELGRVANRVERVPKVLWTDTSDGQPRTSMAEAAAVRAFLSYHGTEAGVQTNDTLYRHIDWTLNRNPKVSIIIPTTGKLDLLRPCMESLLELTEYPDYEVVFLDNSRGRNPEGISYLSHKGFKVIEQNEPFNWSRLNNVGATHANGELLLFLNDDIEITQGNWLLQLVKLASRPDVGAVGALLLYPNGAIQHAGIFLIDHGGGGLHLFHKMMPDDGIYLRLHEVTREVSANTGACLMVSRNKFQEVGGFDEELAVVGNDVDFCLKLQAKGYRNLWTPACRLVHHESISRKTCVPQKDELALWKRWGELFRAGDPYYNPNLSNQKSDCSPSYHIPQSLVRQRFNPAGAPAGNQSLPIMLEGVNLIGYIRAEMGLGEGARSDARAMTAAGIDFCVINFANGNPGRMTDLSWRHKERTAPEYDVNLIHINPDNLHRVIAQLPNYFFKGKYNIGYWAWELPDLPPEWMSSFSHVNEVWVPSGFVRSAVEKLSPVPVVTIPHCIDIKPEFGLTRTHFRIPDDAFVFLAMYDTHSTAQRKNPHGAVEAFKKAFDRSASDVCLVLKVNNSNREEFDRLVEATREWPNIHILTQTHSRTEINALFTLSDCFVSLHRSEGFGLSPAEAMCIGKPTIITNWSGCTDYMTENNCMAIDYSLVEITEDYGPYRRGNVWAEPNLSQAGRAMKDLKGDPELAKQIGHNARTFINERFSPKAVGELIAGRLANIRQDRIKPIKIA